MISEELAARIPRMRAEVETKWAMPDLSQQTEGVGPVTAFQHFLDFAARALNGEYELKLHSALHFEAGLAGEIKPNAQGHYIAPKDIAARMDAEVSRQLRGRIAPLIPAVRSYVEQRRNDPATVNRLAWIVQQIESIPGALKGKTLYWSREQPEGFFRPRKYEPMIWKELHDGLLKILDETTVDNGPSTSERPMERIEWQGSTIEFITIFKKLVERNYVELPSTGGKQGEGNVAEYIRRLQQTYIVRKDDGTEFTTEGLADRWRGRRMGREREGQFDIPEATRKRPRT